MVWDFSPQLLFKTHTNTHTNTLSPPPKVIPWELLEKLSVGFRMTNKQMHQVHTLTRLTSKKEQFFNLQGVS